MEFNFFEYDSVSNLSAEEEERVHTMTPTLPIKCLFLRQYGDKVNQSYFASFLKDVKKLMRYGEQSPDEEMRKTCKFYTYCGQVIAMFYPNFESDAECEYLNFTSISLSFDVLLDFFAASVPFPGGEAKSDCYPALADFLSYYNFIVSNQQQPILFQDITLLFYVITSYPSYGESFNLVDKIKWRVRLGFFVSVLFVTHC
jgi:hypothetical protein